MHIVNPACVEVAVLYRYSKGTPVQIWRNKASLYILIKYYVGYRLLSTGQFGI